jgi:prepilin-type processing-associated H-X9-DG protein
MMRNIVTLVVLAVMAVVAVGVVLSFIGRARETADRDRCEMNLRQLGVALSNYHDAEDSFPPGTVPVDGLAVEDRLSWIAPILGYIESENWVAELDWNQGWNAEKNRPITYRPCRKLLCPSNPDRAGPGEPGLTHYVGIAGLGEDAATLPASHPRAGVFGYDRRTSREEIKNGLSTTVMVVETAWENGPWAAGGPPTVRGLDPKRRPYIGLGRPFGGSHPGGANALFADGSVRFLSDGMSPRVFEAQATIVGSHEAGKFDE